MSPPMPNTPLNDVQSASYAAWWGAGCIESIVCRWISPLTGENPYVESLWPVSLVPCENQRPTFATPRAHH